MEGTGAVHSGLGGFGRRRGDAFWGRAQNHIVHSQALRGGQGLLYGSGYGLPF